MPLVLTQKLVGGQHGDVIGKEYRFPSSWFKLLSIEAGDKFVYYRPAEDKEGRCYFGAGLIESICSDPVDSTVAIAVLSKYQPFAEPIPHRLSDGRYPESGDEASPMFWWSIRFLSEDDLVRIISLSLKMIKSF